ncbi:hypothetical protein A0H76_346 [Hepatospora eriocheir]|uniref:Uncharacterized protein n=1 Tax=Hepatospora eriocheir TaxID=1081669 RepID=A0A1X0QL59_9MICR|nr:hypothetical protein A0H76_346 [Hepatospora eriocheir]
MCPNNLVMKRVNKQSNNKENINIINEIEEIVSINNVKESKSKLDQYLKTIDVNVLVTNILEIINVIKNTPCFYYIKENIYSMCLVSLLKIHKMPNNSKVEIVNYLIGYGNDSKYFIDLFNNIMLHYDELSTFNVNGKSFNNYVLCRIIERIIEDKDLLKNIDFFKNFNLNNNFVDGLISNINSNITVLFILKYVSEWLDNVTIDLRNFKNDNVDISTLEPNYTLFKILKSCPTFYKFIVNDIDNIETMQKEYIYGLFGCDCIKTIVLTIYRRIFNYALKVDKKKLTNIKFIDAFSNVELHGIYKNVKKYPSIFVNIFKQVSSQRYLIYELKKTKSKFILENIDLIELNTSDKMEYFKYLLIILEVNKELELGVLTSNDINLLSKQFNKLPLILKYDISKLLYSYICSVKYDLNNKDVVNMLLYFNNIEIDMKELINLIKINSRKNTDHVYCNNLLILLNDRIDLVKDNYNLAKEIDPVLRYFIEKKLYLNVSGEIFNQLYFMEGKPKIIDMVVLGAINDSNYTSCLAKKMDDENIDIYLSYIYNLKYLNKNKINYNYIQKIINYNNNTLNRLLLDFIYTDLTTKNNLNGNFVNTNLKYFKNLLADDFEYVTAIFILALRNNMVIPVSVIPLIVIFVNCDYLYRNYLDTCVNSVAKSITIATNYIIDDIQSYSNNGFITNNYIVNIINRYTDILFIYNLYNHCGIKKLLSSLTDLFNTTPSRLLFYLYIVLKNIKGCSDKDRDKVFKYLEENVYDENSLNFISSVKVSYRKNRKQSLDVNLLFEYLN